MSAELVPDNPSTITLDSFKPVELHLEFDVSQSRFIVVVVILDTAGERSRFSYTGDEAKVLIRNLNTTDLSTISLRERILLKLQADGHLPAGTVSDDKADLQ